MRAALGSGPLDAGSHPITVTAKKTALPNAPEGTVPAPLRTTVFQRELPVTPFSKPPTWKTYGVWRGELMFGRTIGNCNGCESCNLDMKVSIVGIYTAHILQVVRLC